MILLILGYLNRIVDEDSIYVEVHSPLLSTCNKHADRVAGLAGAHVEFVLFEIRGFELQLRHL